VKVNGIAHRSIWAYPEQGLTWIIDQTRLPHLYATHALASLDDAVEAIRTMRVRGAPLIGATAAYGVALAMTDDPGDPSLDKACGQLATSRPTVNLRWARRGCALTQRYRRPTLDAAWSGPPGSPTNIAINRDREHGPPLLAEPALRAAAAQRDALQRGWRRSCRHGAGACLRRA
jgi:methylthioribose-1-phosphate isomerase